MPVWLGIVVGLSGMAVGWTGLYLAYIRPGRVARRSAEAKEREAVALFMSDQMQKGLRVLIGEPGDPEQGLQERHGVGKRLATLESDVREIKGLLNGGGLGSQIQATNAKIDEHLAHADITKEELRSDIREVRTDVGDIARTVGISEQRVEEKIDALDEKVNVTLAEKQQETEMLRSALQASIEAEPVDGDG